MSASLGDGHGIRYTDAHLFFVPDFIMFHIALYEPQIAPNTGNIIRLAANNGCSLHLIEPLGFDFEEKKAASCRAGLSRPGECQPSP
ncbi:hypothetical protein DZS_46540 [Dickeya ananatis]